jgi:glycosyltransferase involved in cell wall biosynthesis
MRMRLLAVGNMYPPHHLGGYELAWQGAMDALRGAGHEIRVLTTETRLPAVTEPDAPWVARDLRWYWRDHGWPVMGPREVLALERANHAAFARHVEEHRPEAVMWWSMGGMSLSLVAAARRAGLPSAAFVHDPWPVYAPQVDRWTAFCRRHAAARAALWRLARVPTWFSPADVDRWAFVSEHIRAGCEAKGGGPFPGASIASSGIDEAFLDPRPEQPWRWRLLYVGRIDPRKGIETAIAALDHLPEQATLTVVGAGEDPPPAGPRVTFAGAHDAPRLREDYAAADVVLFPVLWEEPWGLVPIEGMGMGRPVVATGRGGSGEFLRDGENALLFEAGDAAALAAAVRRLADDPALRGRLREGGLETARRHTRAGFHAKVAEVVGGLSAAGR